ncbi:MAG: hypothetical protein KDA93_09880 [Planctomycetaceae bacterium]|nr:hypothetical protein [Planctomycetaceae bacterium]
MRNALLMIVFGGIAFAASAAGSWFLQTQATEEAEPATAESLFDPPPLPVDESTPNTDSATSDGDLPVAVRPRPMSVEDILQFGLGLNKREKLLNQREESLRQEEQRLQLALADIHGEQQNLEAMHTKLQGQVAACESLLTQVNEARDELLSERQDAEQELKEFSEVRLEATEQERQNIKRMSEWFQGMDSDKAAGALKELANDGKTDLAVQLLANFEEREAAKILSALDDYALMVELAERFKDLKRPEKKERRR